MPAKPAKPAKTQKTWPANLDEALWDMKGDLLQFASLAFAIGADKLGVATVSHHGLILRFAKWPYVL